MRLLVSFLRKSPIAGVSSSIPWAECRSCSALSRLRASSTHASGKLAIEAASVFNRARSKFSRNRTGSDLGYRLSGAGSRWRDDKAVRPRKIGSDRVGETRLDVRQLRRLQMLRPWMPSSTPCEWDREFESGLLQR